MHPRTLEERLKANGYYDCLASLEAMKRNRDAQYERIRNFEGEQGKANRAFLNALDEEVETGEKAVRDLYDATIALVDGRNDIEFELLQLLERIRLSAEDPKIDPAKVETMREFLHRFDSEE